MTQCATLEHPWFIATYPAPDIDFRTNPFQLVGDMRIFSSPYDCIVGVHSPTMMEGSFIRKYPSKRHFVYSDVPKQLILFSNAIPNSCLFTSYFHQKQFYITLLVNFIAILFFVFPNGSPCIIIFIFLRVFFLFILVMETE